MGMWIFQVEIVKYDINNSLETIKNLQILAKGVEEAISKAKGVYTLAKDEWIHVVTPRQFVDAI